MTTYTLEQSPLAHLLWNSKQTALLWLVLRLYVGYEWLVAGMDKVLNPAWFGSGAGAPIKGFVAGALKKTAEFCPPSPAACHPDVQGWYASFLQGVVAPNATAWANAIAVGEVLVGLGLILGIVTGIAAFFGFVMNMNFMLAGTVSINPVLILLELPLMLAWRYAGYYGGDRFVLPWLRRLFRSGRFRSST